MPYKINKRINGSGHTRDSAMKVALNEIEASGRMNAAAGDPISFFSFRLKSHFQA